MPASFNHFQKTSLLHKIGNMNELQLRWQCVTLGVTNRVKQGSSWILSCHYLSISTGLDQKPRVRPVRDETGPSKQASESETRSSGFESETNLQYHNTGLRPQMTINQWTSKLLRGSMTVLIWLDVNVALQVTSNWNLPKAKMSVTLPHFHRSITEARQKKQKKRQMRDQGFHDRIYLNVIQKCLIMTYNDIFPIHLS